jgi:hypothetical protein
MKYLSKFESYSVPGTELDDMSEVKEKTVEYFKFLSDKDKIVLRNELEQFAKDHNVSFDDLADPNVVKSIFNNSSVHESFASWWRKNWLSLVNSGSKYLRIASLIGFIGTIIAVGVFGIDAEMPMKVTAGVYILANLVACFKGLE